MKFPLTFEKGLNADVLPSELPDGFVSDCSNTRFRAGFAERVPGSSSTATFTGIPAWLGALHTSSATYVVSKGASPTASYVYQVGGSTTATTITRYTEGVTISSATAAGTTVTVTTASAHGMSTGNAVDVWGFSPSSYNVTGKTITVTGATTFTYTADTAPAVSPATLVGLYSNNTAGSSNFGSGDASGGELNGILLMNVSGTGLYYWAGDTSIRLRRVPGSYTARVGRPFGNFIVQLAPTINGTEYPYRICWSTAAEPGSLPPTNGFTASATNQAGDVEKPEIGILVDCCTLGDDLVIYGTQGRILMRYVGGNEVFSFTRLPGEESVIKAGNIVETPVGQVFLDRNKQVLIHNGGECRNISDGRVSSILRGIFGTRAYVVHHQRQNEVWVVYSATSANSPGRVLIWNYIDDTWGAASFSAGTAGGAGVVVNATTLYAGSQNTLRELDAAGLASNSYIERRGITLGDADVIKNLQRSRWNLADTSTFVGSAFTIEHGSHMSPASTPTYATGVTYTPGTTDYCNARATGGRYVAVKMSCTGGAVSTAFYHERVRSAEIDVTMGGKR